MSESHPDAPDRVVMYGADWCSDCRRSKKLLDGLPIEYTYVDVLTDEPAAERARAISGRTNIPVVHFPDGDHQVEPSDGALLAKLQDLGIAH